MTHAPPRSLCNPVTAGVASRMLLLGVGLTLSIIVGTLMYMGAATTIDNDARQRFDSVARSAQYSLSARVKAYTEVVRGLVALYQTHDKPLTRAQFKRYVESLDISRNFPAIEGVNYATYLTGDRRDEFIESVRNDRSVDPDGYPAFTIRPAGLRPEYTVITFMEPMGPMAEIMGVDMQSKPAVAKALATTRDTGLLGASGQPILLNHPTPHIGLGMRLPVYRTGAPAGTVEERRRAYIGSVGIGFGVPALVQGAVDEMAVSGVKMALYGTAGPAGSGALAVEPGDPVLFNDDGTLQAARVGAAERERYFETVLPVNFNGILWKAQFRAKKSDLYTSFDRYLPPVAMMTGFAGTMLIYAFFCMLYWSRRSAIEQRLLLDSVLDSIDAHVYMKDRDRRYRYVNAKTAGFMGRPAEDIIGRLDSEMMDQSQADAHWDKDKDIFDTAKGKGGQVEFVHVGGELRQLWTVKVPVMFNGEVTAVIGLATDVTDLHKLKAQADAANHAKSAFLSNMSHEIRTPMNSIIGMSHLALKSVTNPKQRDYLEKIYHSSQHLLGIINDILDFSKIEAGKLNLEMLDFELDTLMQNIAGQLGDAADAKGLALEFEIAPGLAHQLRGDPLRLEQVLLNFAGNAIKFSANGAVRIAAFPLEEGDGDVLVRFEVRDHGIGMYEDEVASLFQSFHQADASTTRRYGGTGLGLVISKQLAELMGGTVGVESAPGEGSTFWFTARLGVCASFLPAGPQPVAAHVLDEIRGAYILLVEDNIFSQQVGQELLEEAQATVVIANNGREAIDLMLKERFDCVLMDVQMPVMDGFEATRMIRADRRMADSLVIAMTANAGNDDRARCLAAGMDEFVTKPIAPNVLFEVIARWLRTRPRRNGRRRAPLAAESAPTRMSAAPMVSLDRDMLDLNVLSSTFGGNPAKMRKYAFMFLDSARDGLAELEDALDRGDGERVSDLGHRIKSSARAVGATSFGALCLALEDMRGSFEPGQARALVDTMYALLARLDQHIAQELTETEQDRG
ncbi:MAG: CHASE domain-containing protein [Telluria sp.]